MQEKSKYIQILEWAYEKKDTGFTWDELREKFELTRLEERWVKKIFLTTSDNDRKFFEHYYNDDSVEPSQHYYSLNDKGIAAVIDYQDFEITRQASKQAEANAQEAIGQSKWALRIAAITLAIGLVVGGFQIWSTFMTQDSLELTRDQINLATKPQFNIYLRKEKIGDIQVPTFGIENIGKSVVSDLQVKNSVAFIDKEHCSEEEIHATSGGGALFLGGTTRLKPGAKMEETVGWNSDIKRPAAFYTFYITYREESTGRYFAEQKQFYWDGFYIYTDQNMPKTNEVDRLRECAESVKSGVSFNEGDTIYHPSNI